MMMKSKTAATAFFVSAFLLSATGAINASRPAERISGGETNMETNTVARSFDAREVAVAGRRMEQASPSSSEICADDNSATFTRTKSNGKTKEKLLCDYVKGKSENRKRTMCLESTTNKKFQKLFGGRDVGEVCCSTCANATADGVIDKDEDKKLECPTGGLEPGAPCQHVGMSCGQGYIVVGCRKAAPMCDVGFEDRPEACKEWYPVQCKPVLTCDCMAAGYINANGSGDASATWMCQSISLVPCDTPESGDDEYFSELYEDLPLQGVDCDPSNFVSH